MYTVVAQKQTFSSTLLIFPLPLYNDITMCCSVSPKPVSQLIGGGGEGGY